MKTTPSEFEGFLGGLLSRYEPQADSFDVLTEKGDVFRFRYIKDRQAHRDQNAKAKDFTEWLTGGSLPEEWRPFATDDKEFVLYAFHMATLNTAVFVAPVDGGEQTEFPPLSQLQWMTLLSRAPQLFDTLKLALDTKLGIAAVTKDVQGVADAEKKSSQTSSCEPGSGQRETSGTDTPQS